MYMDKMTVHRNRLREQLVTIAENMNVINADLSALSNHLDSIDVCQEDLDAGISAIDDRLNLIHNMLASFNASVGGLPRTK